MKLLIEFLEKPWRFKKLLFQAMFYSVYYKWTIKEKQFATYAAKMGTFKYETPDEPIDDPFIEDMRWIAYAIKRWTPWRTVCFDQALMCKKLLNQHNLPCTLYMGVRHDESHKLIAHAWLRCGNVYVTGYNGSANGYAITAIYGDDWKDSGTEKE